MVAIIILFIPLFSRIWKGIPSGLLGFVPPRFPPCVSEIFDHLPLLCRLHHHLDDFPQINFSPLDILELALQVLLGSRRSGTVNPSLGHALRRPVPYSSSLARQRAWKVETVASTRANDSLPPGVNVAAPRTFSHTSLVGSSSPLDTPTCHALG